MNRRISSILFFIAIAGSSFGQPPRTHNIASLGGAFGHSATGLSADYFHNWKLGKSERAIVGIGVRFTSYFGQSQNYITAPAKLTTGSTGPGVLFRKTINENIDTLLMASPQVNFLNLAINAGYEISHGWDLVFNIDLAGLSLGSEKKEYYMTSGRREDIFAKPTSFNALLSGDNDRGSLNSELYVRYFLSDRWACRIGLQYQFTEYTTNTKPQQFPEPNDRFRKKSALFGFGVSHRFN